MNVTEPREAWIMTVKTGFSSALRYV